MFLVPSFTLSYSFFRAVDGDFIYIGAKPNTPVKLSPVRTTEQQVLPMQGPDRHPHPLFREFMELGPRTPSAHKYWSVKTGEVHLPDYAVEEMDYGEELSMNSIRPPTSDRNWGIEEDQEQNEGQPWEEERLASLIQRLGTPSKSAGAIDKSGHPIEGWTIGDTSARLGSSRGVQTTSNALPNSSRESARGKTLY